MKKKIAICGKGGVGKSLLAYFVARALEFRLSGNCA